MGKMIDPVKWEFKMALPIQMIMFLLTCIPALIKDIFLNRKSSFEFDVTPIEDAYQSMVYSKRTRI
jgi:hypothetical protein